VIRNVCIHVSNEQPLIADLYALPRASDAGLLCTNVRSLDGKRPVFVDSSTATFFFPYHIIRFLEIPEGAADLGRAGEREDRSPAGDDSADPVRAEPASRLPVVVGSGPGGSDDGELDIDVELDEDFLRRIRDL
jgi:hypothetical protein